MGASRHGINVRTTHLTRCQLLDTEHPASNLLEIGTLGNDDRALTAKLFISKSMERLYDLVP